MNNAIVDDINKQLLQFGVNSDDKPLFRVVFSKDQREMRNGEHKLFDDTGTYRNTFIGVREVLKYRWIIEKWILERWAGPELTYHPDIVSARNGDYVCIYIFQDPKGNALPPVWEVARIVTNHVLNPRTKTKALEEDAEIEKKQDIKEEEEIYQGLRLNYERTATEKEESSISAYVEPSKRKMGESDE